MKKGIVLLLCVVMFVSLIPMRAAAESYTYLSSDATNQEITNLISKIGNEINGLYWNGYKDQYVNRTANSTAMIEAAKTGNYKYSTTNKACCDANGNSNNMSVYHAVADNATEAKLYYCTSNFVNGNIQCHGFAWWMGYALFGSAPTTWTKKTSGITFDSVEPGDVIKYFSGKNSAGKEIYHWITVWYKEGSNLYVADANNSQCCRIHFGIINDNVVGNARELYHHDRSEIPPDYSALTLNEYLKVCKEVTDISGAGFAKNSTTKLWSFPWTDSNKKPYTESSAGSFRITKKIRNHVVTSNPDGNLWFETGNNNNKKYVYSGDLDYSAYFTPYSEKQSVGQSTAVMARHLYTTGRDISSIFSVGIVLYDSNGKELKRVSEDNIKITDGHINIWYEIGSGKEVNYALSPGTLYQYKFFAAIDDGRVCNLIESDMDSFTTAGTVPTPTPTPTPAQIDVRFDNSDIAKPDVFDNYACVRTRITVSGTNINNVSKVGCYLYDSNDNLLVEPKLETPNIDADYIAAWYQMDNGTHYKNPDFNLQLTPGTSYKYKFVAIINGTSYYSDVRMFTTTGINPNLAVLSRDIKPHSNGYTVVCQLNYPASLRVATWTEANDQDDLKWMDMSLVKSDATGYYYEYYVSYSDHNNESSSPYINHIYSDSTMLTDIKCDVYSLDLNCLLNGNYYGTLGECGTFDVTINGNIIAKGVDDYVARWISGTTYVIDNIRAKNGYAYSGPSSYAGTLNANADIRLPFTSIFIVTYDANGGSGAPAPQNKQYGQPLVLSNDKIPDLDGYTFKGWSVDPRAETVDYYPGDSYTENADMTLYAVWEKEYLDSGSCGDNLTWTLDKEGNLTISGTGAMDSFSDSIFGSPWNAFIDTIETVSVESGVTEIGSGAFAQCGNLKNIMLSDSVKCIGEAAFVECGNLKNVTLGKGITSINKGAFAYCNKLNGIILPDGLTSIGDTVFLCCTELMEIEIPDSVTYIGNGAFYGCSSLTAISVSEENMNYCSKDGVVYSKDGTTLVQYPTAYSAIYEIPSGTTRIGSYAFSGNAKLTSVTIPKSITDIGEGAFFDCTELKDVFYLGSEEEWSKINIDVANFPLENATIHFNDSGMDIFTFDDVLQLRDWYFGRTEQHPEIGADLSGVTADDLLPYAPVVTGTLPANVEYSGVSLTLEETAMLRFFFTETEKLAENVHFFLNGEEVEPVKRGQYLTLDIPEIPVEGFGTVNTLSVTDGVSTWTMDYSVLSYAQKSIEKNEDAKLTELMKALYLFTD